MKHIFLTACVVLVMFLPSFAQAADLSVAVVDMQALLSKSQVGLSIQEQVEAHRKKSMNDMMEKQQDIRVREQKLLSQRGSVNSADIAKEQKDLEQEFASLQTYAQERKTSLDIAYGKAMTSLMDQVYNIVRQIAKEKGYTLVLTKHSVVSGGDVDISDEAMMRLNASVSDIKLDVN